MNSIRGKWALITGATSGFGKATADLFAKEGCNVIITGRRKERLDKLEELIRNTYEVNVLSLCFDIRDRKAVAVAMSDIPHAWKGIDILVNNAGLAVGLSTIQEGDINDWETMIDTNIKGLLYISRAVMPGMVERNAGHIINIAAVLGGFIDINRPTGHTTHSTITHNTIYTTTHASSSSSS